MIYLINSLSLNLFEIKDKINIDIKKTALDKSAEILKSGQFYSAIGHADLAAVISKLTGTDVPVNRINVKIFPGDEALVAQYVGPRLPEGTTILPEGAKIEWYFVRLT